MAMVIGAPAAERPGWPLTGFMPDGSAEAPDGATLRRNLRGNLSPRATWHSVADRTRFRPRLRL
jgi:hypothetical protein